MRKGSSYVTNEDRVWCALYSVLSVALTVYAALIASEFLYNGIRFTKGPQMAIFVIPVIPVFVGAFVWAFVGPILVGKYAASTHFHRRALTLIGWQAVSCGIIGAARLFVLNAIFGTGLSSTIGLLGPWFLYVTVLLTIAGAALLVAGSVRARRER